VETDINPNKIRTKAVLRNLNSETLAVIAFYFFCMFFALREAGPALHLNGLLRHVRISAATYNRARPSTELRLKALGGGGDRTINVRAKTWKMYRRWRFRTRLNIILAALLWNGNVMSPCNLVFFGRSTVAVHVPWTSNQIQAKGTSSRPGFCERALRAYLKASSN